MRTVVAFALFFTTIPAQANSLASGELRELKTDRPDKTESPQTVDAGHIQIELDAATFTRDKTGDRRIDTVALAPFNLKYGLGTQTDIQLVVAPYQRQTVKNRISGSKSVLQGFGDITLRLKQNVWGNDGGSTSLALMPFIVLPTARRELGADGVEFGIIVPLAVKITNAVDLGLMTEIDGLRENNKYHASFINSATLGFSLAGGLGFYTELYTERDHNWIVTADTGVTLALGSNSQIDAGINVGLTDAADDLNAFVGFSHRF